MKVCVFGNIGSGKTTLIGTLKNILNWNILEIDGFRREYGSGAEETELIARKNFINSITPDTNQLIECTGTGQVADQLFTKLAELDEKVLCIILTTSIDLCKDRLITRNWDIPFPYALENVPSLMRKIDRKIKSGEVRLKWNALKSNAIIERENSTKIDQSSITSEILSLISSQMSTSREIDLMLSEEVQEYYGKEYLSYQSQIINKNDKFLKDTDMIANFIQDRQISGNVLDVGAGSCQWYPFLEETVDHYFAVDANKKALEHTPSSGKLTIIHQNIFDEKFNLNTVIKSTVHYLLFSFFLSHFSDDQIIDLIRKLNNINQILIIDSFWGDNHKKKYPTKELVNIQRKTSKKTVIDLPKRFFDINSLEILADKLGYKVIHIQTGNYWFACLLKNVKES